ncbi:MAG: 4-hydroxy-2-oxovalerate aldolase [Chloroflexi bacterium]|nr:4-hydroxy-2-oxovalerate aldolase [Chloroflexota bacterium]
MPARMKGNRFRELLQSRKFAAGMFVFIPAEAIVDMLGYAGFHFVMFDNEHASYDIAFIERLARAAEAAGIPCIVRLSHPDPYVIARVLDTGVDGLLFARVESKNTAEDIVTLCRIPPMGKRGACQGSRAGDYFLMSQDDYTRRSNDVAIAVMIETKEGLAHAEEILGVPGVDAVIMGPGDLSFSLGVSRDDPRLVEAQEHIIKLAKSAGVTVMVPAKTPEDTAQWLQREDGPRVFFYTTDAYQIGNCFRGLMKRSRELVARFAKP